MRLMYAISCVFCLFLVFHANFAKEPPQDSIIKTEWFETPPVTTIKLADLPPPYNTTSANKGAIVIPVPDKPVLKVPQGYRVNVFASNLRNPRWLQLTPNGDVLLAEEFTNRFRLLMVSQK